MNIYTLSQDLKDHPTRTLRTAIIVAKNEVGALRHAKSILGGEWYVVSYLVQSESGTMLVHTYYS
jgi:hypothetical protein